MQALRKHEHVVSANGAPETRRKDGSPVAGEPDPIRSIEEARGPRLLELKPAMPRYICVGFAVMRI